MLKALKTMIRYPLLRVAGSDLAQTRGRSGLYRARLEAWCARNPCPEFADREELYAFVSSAYKSSEPIHYLEFGVYKGETIRWWAEHCKHPASTFVGFDCFEGLPEEWCPDRPKGTFSTGGAIPAIADPRVSFVKGLFHDTLPSFMRGFRRENRLVVHCDADLFGSTLLVLATVAPFLRPGDLVLFDEFCYPLDEFRAFEDTLAAFPLQLTALGRTKEYLQVALRVDKGIAH